MLKNTTSYRSTVRTSCRAGLTAAVCSTLLGFSPVNAQQVLLHEDFEGTAENTYLNGSTTSDGKWVWSVGGVSPLATVEKDPNSENRFLNMNGEDFSSGSWMLLGSNGRYLYTDPHKPFQIEFDMLNLSGAVESKVLYLDYLLSGRWTSFGAIPDPVGYRIYLRVLDDTHISYWLNQKSGNVSTNPPGTVGHAEVASGVLSTEGVPGRPVRILVESFGNKQKLSIDGVVIYNIDVDPVPQNETFGAIGAIQFWSSLEQPRGLDNITVRQLEIPPPELATPGDVYWANKDTVITGGSDGKGVDVVAQGLSRAIGIAVDSINENVYWTDGNSVMRSGLDGSSPAAVYDYGTSTQGMAINPELGKIYWTEHTNGLFSADLDGSNVVQLLYVTDYGVNARSASVAVNSTTDQVYWANMYDGELIRMEADGSNPESIAVLGGSPYGLAVDGDNNRLYFTRFMTEGEEPNGTLSYLDLTSREIHPILTGLGQPLGLALTASGDGLYWAERIDGKIRALGILPEGFGTPHTLARLEESPFGLALTADASYPFNFQGFLNGDFEADPYDQHWSVNIGGGAKTVAGIAPGSNTAVYIPDDGKSRLIQYLPQWTPLIADERGDSVPVITDPNTGEHRSEYLMPIGPRWQLGFYFAGGTPAAAGDRSLNLILGHVPAPDDMQVNLATINFRITGEGGADAYSQFPATGTKRWVSVFPAGTFESAEVEDGQLVDPTAYYIQLDGDYSTENPFYIVSVGLAGENEFLAVSDPIMAWQNGVPPAGSGIAMVQFHGFVQAPYIIDDIHLIEVVEVLPEGYTAWAEGFFTEGEMGDAAISGPGADADGDGLSNLLEYALVGNPTQASTAEMPVTGTMEASGEVYLTITYTRPTETGVVYNVDASAELSGWMTGPVEVSSTDNGDGTTSIVSRDSVSIGDSSGRRFLRLRVSGE